MNCIFKHLRLNAFLVSMLLLQTYSVTKVAAEEIDPVKSGKKLEAIFQQFIDLGKIAATEANKQVASDKISESDKFELMLLNKLSQIAIGEDITCLGTTPDKCPSKTKKDATTQKKTKP